MALDPTGLYIDGAWVSTPDTIEVADKYHGKVIATLCTGTAGEVDRAVAAARRAAARPLPPARRAEVLHALAAALLQRVDVLAGVVTAETGKLLRDAEGEVRRTAQVLRMCAEEATRIGGETPPVDGTPGMENRLAFTVRDPVGVVAAIVPFNAPLVLLAHKFGPAIAAGNSIVVKSAPETAYSATLLFDLLAGAGFPPGYASLVTGGAEAGAALVAHPGVDLVTFTGSARAGRAIHAAAGPRRTLLELGSNSAAVVTDDADLAHAAETCGRQAFSHAGQVCISVQRVYVQRSRHAEFLDRLTAYAADLVVGDPSDPGTDLGPLLRASDAARVESWLAEATAAGATVRCGGTRNGTLFAPTVVEGAREDMRLVCEEVFGPVVSVLPYEADEDVIELLNAGEYGLQTGVFTRDVDRAMRFARALRMGGVLINDGPLFRADALPYGGIRSSGLGKEGPRDTIREMTAEKLVVLNLR
ncbi:aldehyde dehydrogenase family protein [Streptomyces odontomachi]|uniref:aldehyde dehydrogenase family protein n=1 Tax=Streptomyces odontomachi TaxID=2944940 RepID=UPI00210DB830|nr:aldehyde dehydrogenase family protein [Streptomyces sp. ODS25]